MSDKQRELYQTLKTGAVPEQMPNISQVQKNQFNASTPKTKKPFQWQFLLPKYWGIWLAFAIFLPLVYLPLRWQFKIGKALGVLIFRFAKRRHHDTLTNLRLTFAEKTEEERQQMAEQVFINAGVGLFESLCAWFRPNVFTRLITVSGLQHVKTAEQKGKAVMILGAHYTLLDLGGLMASLFMPVDVVYRPQNNALLEWFIYNARLSLYHDQIDHHNMRHLAKNLKQGHRIWYTPDQDFGLQQGVMAKFFGVSAATVTAQRRLVKLGDKSNPPAVVLVHFYRETPVDMPKGRRPHYHIRFTPVLDNYPSDDELADANRINQQLENLIRIDPTQYMWFHRRFKTQVDGTNYYSRLN
ncbi:MULTISPECIES: lipid A biosynthesis acyltransferase [unclassified Moraxella]|uniref:LpxL/LpxP family acyltransferase n=1 Tax=unclassified Moraxella TaxID=2685852 RepID=UPI003AF93A63